MIPSYPKVFSLGVEYISDILEGKYIVEEKIDGSLFSFGKIKGEVLMRSKGTQIFLGDAGASMFNEGMDYVLSIADRLPEGVVFYCEYLRKNRHNVLNYERTPLNHLCLFDAFDYTKRKFYEYKDLKLFAVGLEVDVVKKFQIKGKLNTDKLTELLEKDSMLGGQKIEGVVVKNYEKDFLLGGQVIPAMFGKFVSERFKEVHRGKWSTLNTPKGKWHTFKEGYKTESRWEKAFQHLRDEGKLSNSPKDIGNLIIEVQKDIGIEEKEIIKEFLWKEFGKELLRTAVNGLPDWYKLKIAKKINK